MIRINLLPVKAAKKQEMLRGQLAILILSIVIVVIASGGLYASLSFKVSGQKKMVAEKEAEINSLKKKIGEVSQFKKRQAELRGKLDVLERLREGKTGPVHLLDELSKVIPDKMWLNSFKENKGSIVITGVSLTEETVAQFMKALESSGYYQNIELKVVEQSRAKENTLQKFEITCRADTPLKQTPNK